MKRVLYATMVLWMVLFVNGCGGGGGDSGVVTQAATTTDVTVERGKVYDARVVDSSNPPKVAVQKKNSNVYTFTGDVTYPVKVTGGWIDVNDDGVMDIDDIQLQIEMISYSNIITPITTYIADANETVRKNKTAALLTDYINMTEDELLHKVPSQSTKDAVILANAIYNNIKVNNNLDKADIDAFVAAIKANVGSAVASASMSDYAKAVEKQVMDGLLAADNPGVTKVTGVMVESFNALNSPGDTTPSSGVALEAVFVVTPNEGTAPLSVSVDASGSTGDIVSYEWTTYDSGSGTPQEITANGITTTLTFTKEPTVSLNKDVYLTITDKAGNKKTTSQKVYVARKASAAFYFESGSCEGESELVKVTGVNSVGEGLTYVWTAVNKQSPGTTIKPTSTSDNTGQNATFSFATAGDYDFTLTVTDKYKNVSVQTKPKSVTLNGCIGTISAANWTIPSSSVCTNNGGEYKLSAQTYIADGRETNYCLADWEQGVKICQAMGLKLPLRSEMYAIYQACESKYQPLDENPKRVLFKNCYIDDGFSERSYWSSEEYALTRALRFDFSLGTNGFNTRTNQEGVTCR